MPRWPDTRSTWPIFGRHYHTTTPPRLLTHPLYHSHSRSLSLQKNLIHIPNFLYSNSFPRKAYDWHGLFGIFLKFMAQKTENEDAEFKVVPETIVLCAKCGVACNSAAANNPCQKCFSASSAVSTSPVTSPGGAKLMDHVYDEKPFRSSSSIKFPPETDSNPAERSGDPKLPVKREVNRCSGCRRKVGLTGFRCRCGDLFCGDHRYSDRHDCSYGYKTTGRAAIARENPVVKAAKIVKI